jgi:hypothetical protein
VPWQSLAKNTHKYCDNSIFPNGFTFLDPIKLKIEPATLLLDHWFQRQTDTQPLFMFKGARPVTPGSRRLNRPGLTGDSAPISYRAPNTSYLHPFPYPITYVSGGLYCTFNACAYSSTPRTLGVQ